jgi:glycosyltransferase involved in cell wall biosynthesis
MEAFMTEMWKLPFVSVIVPAYNDHRLVLALDALRRQTYDRDCYEIVVCDNGSDSDIAADVERVAKDVSARTVYEPTPGSYSARNTALRDAVGEVLAFTDADCIPAADWLASGVAALGGDTGPDLVAGRIEVFPSGTELTMAELFETVDAFPQQRYVERDRFGATANLFVDRNVLDRIGPFDARLRSGGDREFCNRAVDAGFVLTYDADIVVHHPARRSLRELRRKQRRTSSGLFASGVIRPTIKDAIRGFRPPLRTLFCARQRAGVSLRGAWVKYAAVLTFIHYGFAIDRLRCAIGRQQSPR